MGRGNVKIGGGFAHSRNATFNVTSATFNTQVMALQNGSEITVGSHNVAYYDTISVGEDGKVVTRFKAAGQEGAEIGHVYKLKSDGTYSHEWEQAQTASDGKFTYSSATKEITFAAADPEKPVVGDTVVCAYTFKSADNAKLFELRAGGNPAVVKITAFGVARDVCNGELFPCQLRGTVQIDGNWNWDISADGEVAVHTINMEFVKTCTSDLLYEFLVYTEDEYEDETEEVEP